MAVLWDKSLVPWHDASNAPYVGLKAYFFDVGTTTPQIVWTDEAESIPHDHPVVANANGSFPAIYLTEQTSHRLRIVTAGGATLHDVDNINVPTTAPPEFPDSETPTEQLFTTGDIKMSWRSSAPTGWVRCNARTIGAAASGASERANDDCEALFLFLWNNDASLAVAGGRGGTATGDWAADKTIALPDFRGRVPMGPDSFGNSAAGRVTDAVLGADSDTFGLAGGSQTHTLTKAELPTDAPEGTVAITDPGHIHTIPNYGGNSQADGFGTNRWHYGTDGQTKNTNSATTGITAAFTGDPLGDGDPHNNLQPSIITPFFIKL